DHLEAAVAQGAGDDLGAAIVAVEPRLGDQDAQATLSHAAPQIHAGSRYTPNTSRNTSEISPTVHSPCTAAMIGGIRFWPLAAAARTAASRSRTAPRSRACL